MIEEIDCPMEAAGYECDREHCEGCDIFEKMLDKCEQEYPY